MSSIVADAHTPSPASRPLPDPSPSTIRRKTHFDHRSSFYPYAEFISRDDDDDGSTCSGIAYSEEVSEAEYDCEVYSGNDIYSCFPTNATVVPQHQWLTFVWNSRNPYFTETNEVMIYLYNADSLEELFSTSQSNPSGEAGQYRYCVNDTFWGADGADWDGQNITSEYYWVVTPSTNTVNQTPLYTFTAVQTTYADSVALSISSAASASSASAASASSASASAAAASSRSAATATTTNTVGTGVGGGNSTVNPSSRQPSATSTTGSGSGSVQSLSSSKFPGWGIAVIVVLGFLALVAGGILAFFITRRIRARRGLINRGSMGSASPMMANAANADTVQSPLLESAMLGAGAGAIAADGASQRPTSPTHDGASTMSRTSEAALFSAADAAIMAQAFKSALRKPDFAEQPVEEGESPDSQMTERAGGLLLAQELAEEGRDIRSVGSSRGVRVETLSDAADDDAATTSVQDDAATTIQDHPH